jgi:hypothetical protein
VRAEQGQVAGKSQNPDFQVFLFAPSAHSCAASVAQFFAATIPFSLLCGA